VEDCGGKEDLKKKVLGFRVRYVKERTKQARDSKKGRAEVLKIIGNEA
jgi:hypothetical protein